MAAHGKVTFQEFKNREGFIYDNYWISVIEYEGEYNQEK